PGQIRQIFTKKGARNIRRDGSINGTVVRTCVGFGVKRFVMTGTAGQEHEYARLGSWWILATKVIRSLRLRREKPGQAQSHQAQAPHTQQFTAIKVTETR